MSKYQSFSLTAARREAEVPEGIEIENRGEHFVIPSEFPVDVLAPIFDSSFDLESLVAEIARGVENDVNEIDLITQLLVGNPNLPGEMAKALQAVAAKLFGDVQPRELSVADDGSETWVVSGPSNWERWVATRPSLQDYGRLIRFLVDAYGVGLGELLGSSTSSGAAGTSSKEISSATTASISEASGDDPASSTASSASADSSS